MAENLFNIEDLSYTHGSCKLFDQPRSSPLSVSFLFCTSGKRISQLSWLDYLEVNRPLQNNCHCKTKVADVYNAALIGLAVALFLQSERQLKEARQELTLLVSNIIRIANIVAKHLLFWDKRSVIFKLRVSNSLSQTINGRLVGHNVIVATIDNNDNNDIMLTFFVCDYVTRWSRAGLL